VTSLTRTATNSASSAPTSDARLGHRRGPVHRVQHRRPLDHSLIGVLAGLLEPLASAGISILAESPSTPTGFWSHRPGRSAAEAWIVAGTWLRKQGQE
jgi:hypothetical protein